MLHFYRVYHSMRYVDGDLVLRLQHALPRAAAGAHPHRVRRHRRRRAPSSRPTALPAEANDVAPGGAAAAALPLRPPQPRPAAHADRHHQPRWVEQAAHRSPHAPRAEAGARPTSDSSLPDPLFRRQSPHFFCFFRRIALAWFRLAGTILTVPPCDAFGDWATPREPAAELFLRPFPPTSRLPIPP